MKKLIILLASAIFSFSMLNADTLGKVKKRGHLICGVNTGLAGFSSVNNKGKWIGLDVDYCRAIASAIFKDANKVTFVPLTAKERFTALQTGEIDILSRNTTWTATRDISLGLNFVGVMYYDGQGFLIKKSLEINSAKDLDGASVCIQSGTTTELNTNDYFKINNMKYKAITYDTTAQAKNAFEKGRCDVLTSDQSHLYSTRSTLKHPSKYKILPEIISKEPLGPVVRQGDDKWFNIARWTLFALLEAEELEITKSNIRTKAKNRNPKIKRLLGYSGTIGKQLGLNKKWAYYIIKNVGNYSEIFERNVGTNTPLKIKRGLNALWINGGLMYSMPAR